MIADDFPATVDVIVLGAGLAGHCAALRAVREGATVLLVEKDEQYGGSSSSGPGTFAFAGTLAQQAQGLVDSGDLLRQDLIKAGGGFADPSLIDSYVAHQHETYEWLLGEGVEFERVEASPYQTVARSHPVNAATVVQKLHDSFVEEAGATYLSGCRSRMIIRDHADGPVEVVTFEHAGQVYEVRATRAVILATGGFLYNDELIRKFAPTLTKGLRMGGRANEGDGLLMGWSLGAGVVDTEWLTSSFGASVNISGGLIDTSDSNSMLLHPIYKGGIAVNKMGKRFCDESKSYQVLGARCLEQPGGLAFQVFDQRIMDASVPNMMTRDFRKGLEAGVVHSGDSIEELAVRFELDPTQLSETVQTYNRYVDSKQDIDFGRDFLVNNQGDLVKIDNGPFYVYPCTAALLSSYGGLTVDARARVIDVYGKVIERLYAVGEITGGLFGSNYMSGTSLGKSAIFGQMAGKEAAHLSSEKTTL